MNSKTNPLSVSPKCDKKNTLVKSYNPVAFGGDGEARGGRAKGGNHGP